MQTSTKISKFVLGLLSLRDLIPRNSLLKALVYGLLDQAADTATFILTTAPFPCSCPLFALSSIWISIRFFRVYED